MSKHVGIVACSAEGAALCYRTICLEAESIMGAHAHPEVSMHTHPLSEYMRHLDKGGWEGVARLMLASAQKLAAIGADFLVCPDNTIHQAFDLVSAKSPVPWLHIAEVVALEARARGFKSLGVMGTRFLMEGPVYPSICRRHGITCRVPEAGDRERIDDIIFSELVRGKIRPESRSFFKFAIRRLGESGCEAVVLACTEIPLLVAAEDSPLPTLDSTRLLARAAVARATETTHHEPLRER